MGPCKDFEYCPQGTCASRIHVTLEGDVLRAVRFEDGCEGNLTAIGRLVLGRNAREVADMLRGVTCEDKPTSCPDQLARAIDAALDGP